MTMTIQDPVTLAAANALIGTVVPANTKRKYTFAKAYNGTGAPVVLKVFLIPSGGTITGLNAYIQYTLQDTETYLCPEIVGAALGPGGQMAAGGLGLQFSCVASDGVNI